MKTCTIHVLDEVNCRIGGLYPEDLEVLWDKFGFFVDGYFHNPSYQLRRWDGKIRFFDKHGNTHTKLLNEILPYLASWGYDLNLVDKRRPAPVITDRIDESFFNLEKFKLRPYQVDVVNALLAEGSGFAISATGSGKTAMVAALAMVLYLNGLQTIVIVPSGDLVTQTADEFREKLASFGDAVSVGEYSGGVKEMDHPIVVATWQSLQNAPHYLSGFQAVVVDEAHGLKANVIKELINVHGKHISHRYGCTGTFPKGVVDQYSLKVSIGQVIREVPAKWLIEQGYLASIEIEPVETKDTDPELPDYASEKAWLTRNEDRNAAIAQLIQQKRDQFGNTMVLVTTNSLAQGRELNDLIPGSVYLDGKSGKDTRAENYEEYTSRNDVIVIASAGIASTGISIDRIFCLILVDTGKSFVKCIQSVGRGLRLAEDKKSLHVVDIYSKVKFAKKHYKERAKHYTEAGYPLLVRHQLNY